MNAPLFTIRTAEERDLVYLQMICEEGGLAIIEGIDEVSVAVNDENLPVGFVHIKMVNDDKVPRANGAYVYPVAVFEEWRHHGVASALLEYELVSKGELKLVACKPSQDFYPKAGFEQVSWDNIAAIIAHDCDHCVAKESCAPVPFCKSV